MRLIWVLLGSLIIASNGWSSGHHKTSIGPSNTTLEPNVKYRNTRVLISSQLVQTLSKDTINTARYVAFIGVSGLPLPDGQTINDFITDDLLATHDVAIYRIIFRSKNINGKSTKQSGLVVVPTTSGVAVNSEGLLVYMHATTTQRNNAAGNRSEEAYAAIGIFGGYKWVLAMPDYLGYGKNHLPHPYALGKLNAPSGRYIIEATKELVKKLHCKVGSDLFITGYSEGGGNALWLARYLENLNKPSMIPTKVAPMSGAYDLSYATALSFIGNQPPVTYSENFEFKPTFLAFAAVGASEVLQQGLTNLIKKPLAKVVEGKLPGLLADSAINVRLVTTATDQLNYLNKVNPTDPTSWLPDPQNLLKPNFVTAIQTHDETNPTIELFVENDNVDWNPNVQILLLGVIQDDVVPFAASTYPLPAVYTSIHGAQAPYSQGNAQNVIHAMRGNGYTNAQVGWLGLNGAVTNNPVKPMTMTHADGILPCMFLALEFFNGRPLTDFPQLANP